MQSKIDPENRVFGLSSWVGGLLGPAIRTYHSRTTRRQLEREIPRLVRQGSLSELFNLIENREKREQDVQGYAHAEQQYAAARTEIEEIESEDDSRAEKGMEKGQQTAAMISVIMTIIFICMYFLIETY